MANVGLLQFDILWEDPQGNIEKVQALLQGGSSGNCDLIVLPELWICGFTMNKEAHLFFEEGLAFMKKISSDYDCAVMGGLPWRGEEGQENRAYLVHGAQVKAYTKLKAFKFAGEHLSYEQGSQPCRWVACGFNLSPFICYDLRFPELAREMVPKTNLFVYMANWPMARERHWRQLLIARAIENLAYVIGVNRIGRDGLGNQYSGASLVIDPTGEVLLDAGSEQGLFHADIQAETVAAVRTRWPFLNDR